MQRPCHFCGPRSRRLTASARNADGPLFGLAGIAAGASQSRNGKVNRRMVTAVLVLGGSIFVGAQLSLTFL